MVSNCLSGIILNTFGAVRTLTELDTEVVTEIIDKPKKTIICADMRMVKKIELQFRSIPNNILIVPVSDFSVSQSVGYPILIDIGFDKNRIIDALNRATDLISDKTKINKKSKHLSPREKTVLKLVAKGMTTKMIAEKLNISDQTVSGHRKNIISKLEIKSASGLTAFAIINGLIDLDETNLY